jgi:Cys-tRNA(Pro)/Cys-tRNA(Cys) deacylase
MKSITSIVIADRLIGRGSVVQPCLMSKTTPATLALTKIGVPFTTETYHYDPDADRVGLQAAEALGVSPTRVLKTLMAEVDGKPVCVVVPSDEEVNMKKLAAAFGGKSAQMMKPVDAERLTGYKVGGISPFGQRKAVPTCVEELATLEDEIFLNGGQRGLQILMKPQDLVTALGAQTADLIR